MGPSDRKPIPAGPCRCGSGLPPMLCCLARDSLAANGQPLAFAPTDDSDAATVDQWDLALTTVAALASVLPDVPVPLLANRAPRELHAAGPDERAAALSYLDSVARTAEALGVPLNAPALRETLTSPTPPPYALEDRQRVALAAFTLQMLSRGFDPSQVLGAHRLFRDVMRTLQPTLRRPLSHAATIDYACCWMHFRPEGREEVAALYRVSPSTISKHFAEIKRELKLVWYDPRYAVQEPAWQEMLEETARALAEGEPPPSEP